jgi:superfamily II DNA or RNA helicase
MRRMSDLFPHQRAMVQALLDHPHHALLVQPGYGKTAAVLTALQELGAWPALVVGPQRVSKRVWPEEAAQWEHLRDLQVVSIHGTPGQRVKRLGWDNHVECISYENYVWLTDTVDVDSRYKAIVFDELSKLKSPGSKRFRRLRARGMKVPIRIGLTGTPIGNHTLDLWAEMFAVAGEKPLGPTYSGFRERYFHAVDYYQRDWQLARPEFAREINLRVKPWCFTVSTNQPAVKMPKLHLNRISVDYPENVQKLGEKLERELFMKLDSGLEVEALSASTVAGKLQQLASGAVYLEPDKPAWEEVHAEKVDALEDLVDELQGEPLLVFHWFKHEVERIRKRLGKRLVTIDEKGSIERWNRREVEVLLAHPASAGHGLNLQHGGHNVAWFTLPWSHELWTQANGRLVRPGQRSPLVTSHVLLCGEVDRRVLEALAGKAKVEQDLFSTLLGT